MPYIQSKMLILVSAEQISFQNADGETVKKWKYLFLKPDNNLLEGYDDNGLYKDDVKTVVSGYSEEQAKPYPFEARIWKGQTSWRLLAGGVKKK